MPDGITPIDLILTASTCSLLPGNVCGQAATVSKKWRQLLYDDLLWKGLCGRELGLLTPELADGSIAPTFRCEGRRVIRILVGIWVCGWKCSGISLVDALKGCSNCTTERSVSQPAINLKDLRRLQFTCLNRQAYASWKEKWEGYGKLGPRAMRVWRHIEGWTAANVPDIRKSLR